MKFLMMSVLLLAEVVWIRGFEWGFPSILALFLNVLVGYYLLVPKEKHSPRSISNSKLTYVIILLVVGVLFHFYAIDSIPQDMYGFDVARDTQQVQQVVDTKKAYILYENFSKEPLYYHLAALVDSVIHDEFMAMKIVGAAAGVMTALVLFIMLTRLNIHPFVAFFTSILFTFSSWQMLMERLAYRASLVPLFVVLVFYAAIQFHTYRKARYAYFLGLGLAAGFYIYTTYWVVPLAVGIFLVLSLLVHHGKKRAALLRGMLIALVAFIIALAPLLSFIYQHPEVYFQRMRMRGQEVANRNFTLEQRAASFYRNYTNTVNGVIKQGTSFPPYENTSPYQKGLDDITMWLFLAGLGYALISFKKNNAQLSILLLFIAFIPTSLMSIGYETETPNFSRMIVALPMVYITIAYMLHAIASRFITDDKNVRWMKYGGVVIAIIVMAFVAHNNASRIFVDFPKTYPFGNQPIYSMISEERMQHPEKNIYMYFYADPEVMERYVPGYKDNVFFGESIGVADYGRLYFPPMPADTTFNETFIIIYPTSLTQEVDISRYVCTSRQQGDFTFATCSF